MGLYDIRWQTPAQSEVVVMPIKLVISSGAEMTRLLVSLYAAGSAVMIGQVRVPGGIEGKTLQFDGL